MSEVSPEVTESGMRKAALAWISGAKKEKCAEIAGVDYTTFWRWMRSPRWKDVCLEVMPELHGELLRNARAVLMHHLIETKDAKVAMFVLERLDDGQWARRGIAIEPETITRFVVTVEGVKSWQDDETEGTAPGDTDD